MHSRIKIKQKAHQRLSFADAFGATATREHQGVFVMGDPEFKSTTELISFQWLILGSLGIAVAKTLPRQIPESLIRESTACKNSGMAYIGLHEQADIGHTDPLGNFAGKAVEHSPRVVEGTSYSQE